MKKGREAVTTAVILLMIVRQKKRTKLRRKYLEKGRQGKEGETRVKRLLVMMRVLPENERLIR